MHRTSHCATSAMMWPSFLLGPRLLAHGGGPQVTGPTGDCTWGSLIMQLTCAAPVWYCQGLAFPSWEQQQWLQQGPTPGLASMSGELSSHFESHLFSKQTKQIKPTHNTSAKHSTSAFQARVQLMSSSSGKKRDDFWKGGDRAWGGQHITTLAAGAASLRHTPRTHTVERKSQPPKVPSASLWPPSPSQWSTAPFDEKGRNLPCPGNAEVS